MSTKGLTQSRKIVKVIAASEKGLTQSRKIVKVIAVAKRKAARAVKAEKMVEKKSKQDQTDFKLALAILIFGAATAFSAVYKLGNITILLGVVTAAAALAMTLKK